MEKRNGDWLIMLERLVACATTDCGIDRWGLGARIVLIWSEEERKYGYQRLIHIIMNKNASHPCINHPLSKQKIINISRTNGEILLHDQRYRSQIFLAPPSPCISIHLDQSVPLIPTPTPTSPPTIPTSTPALLLRVRIPCQGANDCAT